MTGMYAHFVPSKFQITVSANGTNCMFGQILGVVLPAKRQITVILLLFFQKLLMFRILFFLSVILFIRKTDEFL